MPSQKRLRALLLDWFKENARALPWRGADPYRVWLSEILLQQTRVAAGLPYYRRFVERFPTVNALAKAHQDDVLKAWEGLGYYARARNLHAAARHIATERRGQFPETAREWLALPGVGSYTAAAVASIAFGEDVASVDGNARRVLARWFQIERPANTSDDGTFQQAADRVLPRGRAGDWNQAVMELGATVCLPRRPRCRDCPVTAECGAFRAGEAEAYPRRLTKKTVPHVEVVAGAIGKNGRWLLGKRDKGMLRGLWEFPGGKIEPGETPEAALRRELREELGIGVKVGECLGAVDHAFSHFTMTLALYRCRLTKGEPRTLKHAEIRWAGAEDFAELAFPAADRKLIGFLGV